MGSRCILRSGTLVAVMVTLFVVSGCTSSPPSLEECPTSGPERTTCVGRAAAHSGNLSLCWDLAAPDDASCAPQVYTSMNDPSLCSKVPAERGTVQNECLIYFGAVMEGGIGGATATPVIVRQE